VSAETAGREAARRATPAKKDAINERFFMMLLPRKLKKLKRVIGRSAVHAQHSGAGGIPVLFLGPTTGDRRKEAVMDWARILAYVTGTVGPPIPWKRAIRPLWPRPLRGIAGFPGSSVPVIGIAVAMESAKLVTVGSRTLFKAVAVASPRAARKGGHRPVASATVT
jgi:hypothetical protein